MVTFCSTDFPNGVGTKFSPIRQIVCLTSVTKANAKRLESGGLRWEQRTAIFNFVAMYSKDALLPVHDMTTLKKALETTSTLPPQLATSKWLGRDSMDPATCGVVKFGVADHEVVVEALQALNVLKDEPVNEPLEGATCQQN